MHACIYSSTSQNLTERWFMIVYIYFDFFRLFHNFMAVAGVDDDSTIIAFLFKKMFLQL